MTRIGRRLIEDFLLPALNDEKYGELLKWVDREKRYFSIRWSHKNAAKWTLSDTAVFQDWDRLKGHYHPEIKGYYMQAKQRFRAALYKLNTVRKVDCEDKHVKKYQLILNPDKKHEIMSRKAHRHKEDNQKSIPTPVICRNTSFVAKKCTKISPFEESSSLLSSPSFVKSEYCDKKETEYEIVEEYQRALKNQRKWSSSHYPLKTIKTEGSDYPVAVLRERPQVNIHRSPPHVPIQPAPVYQNQKCAFRQSMENSQMNEPLEIFLKHQSEENSQKRLESPHLLLVKTYNDDPVHDNQVRDYPVHDINNSLERNAISVLCHGLPNNNCIPERALNLSVKSEDGVLCR